MRVLIHSLTVSLLFFQNTSAVSQDLHAPGNGYYIIIGSFAIQSNAAKFVQKQKKEGVDCRYFFDHPNRIYYVYKDILSKKELASEAVMKLRKDEKFFDAWFKKIPPDPPSGYASDVENMDLLTKDSLSQAGNQGNTEAFFNLYNSRTNKPVSGKVKIIDPAHAILLDELEGNKYVLLPALKNMTGKLSLICDVFGYQKMQYDINILDPLSDSTSPHVELLDSALIVHFGLVKYRRGDIVTLYKVYFYNDAAIMMSESKFQLKELTTLMFDNPSMRIRLHGHTNGSYFGKIISPTDPSNFFSLSKDSREETGSAKILSHKRAEVVRNYLIATGVSPHRIQVKAWGGKRPLFDKHSVKAKQNLRVDVEIIQD